MRIVVVGATGGLGRDVVAEALAGGHETTALVRDPARAALPGEVEIAQGDVLDRASLTGPLEGRDAVICALGTPSPRRRSTLLEQGTANLVAAMSEAGVRRLACVTLLGVGSSGSNASLFYREDLLRVLAPDDVRQGAPGAGGARRRSGVGAGAAGTVRQRQAERRVAGRT